MQLVRQVVISILAALGLALPGIAAERAIIVLDGSGSMWAQIDGVPRISIARDTLSSVLSTLPSDLELGLMTYGHRERGNCSDIEMLVEAAPGTSDRIVAAANKINPKGMTPLSDAVRLAAENLRYTEERATVILITDGLETCEIDPCALGNELESMGIDFTAHVLGFGLSDDEGRQVACLAENTGGQYLSASDGAALVDALTATVAEVAKVEPKPEPEPEPEPDPEVAALEQNFTIEAALSEGGELLGRDNGEFYWELSAVDGAGNATHVHDYGYGVPTRFIEPGDYTLKARYGHVTLTQPVTITADELAAPYFMFNAGIVIVRGYAAEGQPVDSGAAINITFPGGDDWAYGQSTFYLPAGEITASVRIGDATASETFTLRPGETVEKEIIASVGIAVLNASYVDGLLVEDDGLAVTVFRAAQALDGSRESVSSGYGPGDEYQLSPGDYLARFKLGEATAETPFSVVGGQRVEVMGLLNAGVAAIDAPNAYSISLFHAKKDIQGNRKSAGFAYGETLQTTLPAGDYVAVVDYQEAGETEMPFSITAGERTETAIRPPKN